MPSSRLAQSFGFNTPDQIARWEREKSLRADGLNVNEEGREKENQANLSCTTQILTLQSGVEFGCPKEIGTRSKREPANETGEPMT